MTTQHQKDRLSHFPLAFFAMVMGLAGLSISWLKASEIMGFSNCVGTTIAIAAASIYAILFALYTAKLIKHPTSVKQEIEHPIKLNFLATVSISLLLLTVVANHLAPTIAKPLFSVATIVHLAVTLFVLNCWIHRTNIEVTHLNPAWFIPIVGNVIVPVALPQGFPHEIGMFFFAIGVIFWLSLLAVVLNRLFFHNPIPQRLLPTLAILIAPPSVAFLAYIKLTGKVDFFAEVLLAIALFFTILLAMQVPRLTKIPFALSWWAYSFPLTAVTTASFVYAHITGFAPMTSIAIALLIISNLVIALLIYKTAKAVMARSICQEE